MIPKWKQVLSLDDLRPVVHCPIVSKLAELVIKPLILSDMKDNLESSQFGSLKGLSTDHYLATLYQELNEAAEEKLTTVLITWDYKAAFTSMKHQVVVQSAADLGARPSLVSVVASYLARGGDNSPLGKRYIIVQTYKWRERPGDSLEYTTVHHVPK